MSFYYVECKADQATIPISDTVILWERNEHADLFEQIFLNLRS